jgi:hypothetical protein
VSGGDEVTAASAVVGEALVGGKGASAVSVVARMALRRVRELTLAPWRRVSALARAAGLWVAVLAARVTVRLTLEAALISCWRSFWRLRLLSSLLWRLWRWRHACLAGALATMTARIACAAGGV